MTNSSFPGSAWERTALPALPAWCEAEPRGQWVTRQSLVTRASATREDVHSSAVQHSMSR